MNTIRTALATALILSSSYANASSNAFSVDARSLAMGNSSVATANIATAALANPAMLVLQKEGDDFALLLPAIGIYIDDSDKLTDAIDDFQIVSDACVSTGSTTDCSAAVSAFNNLLGKSLAPQVTGATALGFSGEEYSFAFSARANATLAGGVNDTDFLVDITPTGLQLDDRNILELRGVQTKEIAVSAATALDLAGMKIAVGVTPKVVNVESVVFQRSVATLDTGTSDLLDENIIVDLGSFTTIDAGVMLEVAENIQFGLVARNLLSEELVDNSGLIPVTLKFDTSLRAGAAFTGDVVTVGIDMDLTENDPIITTFGAQKTQLLSLGAEIDAFDIAQLRVGMQKNMASGANGDALLTAGVGLWLGFTLDLAVISGDDVFGAFFQTGFRF